MITNLVRPAVAAMPDIDWGEVPDGTPYRLLWGENQQVFPGCERAIMDEVKNINLYPSPTKAKLRQKIAEYNGLDPDNIVVTNGSDDAIELIAKVFVNDGDEVIMPAPTFPVFGSSSQMMGASVVTVPLGSDFSLDLKALLQSVTPKTKIIWIANPNNPTGNLLLTPEQVEDLVQRTECLVVIDECYFELAGVTVAPLVKQYPRLVVLRSFSKVFALAGVRLGYIIANPEPAMYPRRVQQANQVFGVNRFAQAAGIAVLEDPARAQEYCRAFQDAKERFEAQLAKIGLTIMPTKTTFCLIKLPDGVHSKQLKAALQAKGIMIKDCSIYKGLGEQYACLGVPAGQYQAQCVQAIKEALEELC